jgi:hypothetical protein
VPRGRFGRLGEVEEHDLPAPLTLGTSDPSRIVTPGAAERASGAPVLSVFATRIARGVDERGRAVSGNEEAVAGDDDLAGRLRSPLLLAAFEREHAYTGLAR